MLNKGRSEPRNREKERERTKELEKIFILILYLDLKITHLHPGRMFNESKRKRPFPMSPKERIKYTCQPFNFGCVKLIFLHSISLSFVLCTTVGVFVCVCNFYLGIPTKCYTELMLSASWWCVSLTTQPPHTHSPTYAHNRMYCL